MSPTPLITIIDDDDEVRIATSALVRSLGYQARAYASAEAFLASDDCGASDCLIVDVQMPGMSGPQLQKTLMARPRPAPMVFITAFPDAAARERVMAAGAVVILGKPCEGKALVDSIEAALAPRR